VRGWVCSVHHCGVQEWAEADLAWRLAELVAGRLTDVARTTIFADLGAGESYRVIVKLLETAVQDRVSVPPELVAALHEWLDSYRGAADEPRLRALLDRIT
jgi:spermidine synthase